MEAGLAGGVWGAPMLFFMHNTSLDFTQGNPREGNSGQGVETLYWGA